MIKDFFANVLELIYEFFSQEEVWLIVALLALGGGLILFIPDISLAALWDYIVYLLKLIWPFLLFIVLLLAFESLWLFWRQEIFKKKFEYTLLEIRIPRETEKSPRSMEHVLVAIHSLINAAGNLEEKYWDGEITLWSSLEIASFDGEIHFYIWTLKKRKHIIEAAFMSYYPDVEIVEVEDYTPQMPKSYGELLERNLNCWGTEIIPAREEAYPIKTYPQFIEQEREKEHVVDPISSVLEILHKIKPGEMVAMQIIIAPALYNWHEKWRSFVEKLKEPKMKKEEAESEEGARSFRRFIMRSPGETDVLKAVENNLSKPAFKTLIRFVYISPRDIYYQEFARRSIVGVFKQYTALDLNSLVEYRAMSTRAKFWDWPHIFPKRRVKYKRHRMLYNCTHREFPPETWMGRLITSTFFNLNFTSKMFTMSTESVATLFHPPMKQVLTTPHVKRIESAKGSPPVGIDVFGEEEEIEKYYR